MKKLQVLVVDDSAFMRKLITSFINSHTKMTVCGIARNGEDAIRQVDKLRPDVITMDVEMPVMDGIKALRKIMNVTPTPVVMLSSATIKGANQTLLAMQYGAIDFIVKPSGTISLDLHKVKDELLEKVLSASIVDLKKMTFGEKKYKHIVGTKRVISNEKHWSKQAKKIICIGTSTGGPRALQKVLAALPKSFGAPILVVQHMPSGFTKLLANRLNALCEIEVKEVSDGEILKNGTAYIAVGGYHLTVQKIGNSIAAKTTQTQLENGLRPSFDILLESVSEQLEDYNKIIVIMTGMGADGSMGLLQLKGNKNLRVIAESKETSIIFGMPNAAIATNMVDKVKKLEEIAHAIMTFMK